MSVRSRRTTVPYRVTAVCMEAMPAFVTRSSHVPGRSDVTRIGNDTDMTRKMRIILETGMDVFVSFFLLLNWNKLQE